MIMDFFTIALADLKPDRGYSFGCIQNWLNKLLELQRVSCNYLPASRLAAVRRYPGE